MTLPITAAPDPAAVARMARPRSIAIVGMSARPGSNGQALLTNLRANGFAGEIHLVGRSGGEIDGLPVLSGVDDLPEDVDLALLAVPSAGVRDAVAACVRRRVHVAVIYASGFAEFGEQGRAEQAEISELARAGGVHLVGPNCIGYTNYVDPLNTVFLPDPPIEKLTRHDGTAVAILAQSGGLMGLIHQGLRARGLPVSYRFSTGNEAGLSLGDYLAFLGEDPSTGGVVIYAEDVRHPQSFLAAVRSVRASGKFVVVMHTGRSAVAQRAAASHTGALTSDYAVIKVLAAEAGAVVIESLEELVDVAELLARYPSAPGGGLGLMTTSGAFCAIALDELDDLGLGVAPLSTATLQALRERLPDYMKPDNPLDLGTAVVADPELFHDGLAAMLADDGIGAVTLAVPYVTDNVNMEMLRQVTRAAEGQSKPVAVALFGDVLPLTEEMRAYATEHGMVVSTSPERALRAMAAVARYLALTHREPAAVAQRDAKPLPGGRLSEWQGKQYLAELGIPIPAGALATNVDEAVATAARIGYPVVAKAQAPALLHKTEAGGVVLGIADEAALRAAFTDLVTRLGSTPGAPLDGVLIESMAASGLELVVGAKRHPGWGPVVVAGLGGIWVEALGDIRLMAPGTDIPAIVDELRQLRSAALLGPFRGAPAVDIDAVAQVVAAVGRLVADHPEIEEIDINPLVARPDGVTALDVLITTSETAVAAQAGGGL